MVEVNTHTETVHDTAYVQLPVYIERNVTRDTTSTLENPYAKSLATVKDGFLSHSLETKPVKHPVKVEKTATASFTATASRFKPLRLSASLTSGNLSRCAPAARRSPS